ncbi:hypothetical protein CEXT_775271 [Caerostris extrusa]|uniref:Uncharacterized protein n=1 Tax=Caerostris extrusa TaxID=172846 RepID=A0AAV4MKX5_CAEEX|nr:hypothetical protein CEXT_775271 [Caerostris extrusa]
MPPLDSNLSPPCTLVSQGDTAVCKLRKGYSETCKLKKVYQSRLISEIGNSIIVFFCNSLVVVLLLNIRSRIKPIAWAVLSVRVVRKVFVYLILRDNPGSRYELNTSWNRMSIPKSRCPHIVTVGNYTKEDIIAKLKNLPNNCVPFFDVSTGPQLLLVLSVIPPNLEPLE